MRLAEHPAAIRRFAQAVVSALVLTMSIAVLTSATAPSASAGVYIPNSCASVGWGSIPNVFYKSTANDDVVRRDVQDYRNGDVSHLAYNGPLDMGMTAAAWTLRRNDTAVDSVDLDRYDAMLVRGPSHAATFRLDDDGGFHYSPVPGYLGGDSFQYLLQLNARCTNVATVTLPAPERPRLLDDSYTVLAGQPFASPLACADGGRSCGVLRNDLLGPSQVSWVTDDPFGSSSVQSGGTQRTANGEVVVQPDGRFVYTPDPGFEGTDAFYYTSDKGPLYGLGAHGGVGGRYVYGQLYAKVTLTVQPTTQTSPVARPDLFETLEDQSLPLTAAQLLSNDVRSTLVLGVNGTVSASSVRTPNGSIAVTWSPIFGESNCTILFCPRSATAMTYTPDPDFVGIDSFTYVTATNYPPSEFSIATEVAIDVKPVADPPAVSPDGATLQENTSVTIDVLANDSDPDGDLDPSSIEPDPCVELPVCIFKSSANGSWVINSDGTITYTPTPGFVGTAGFHYQVSDARGVPSRTYVIATVTANPAVDDAYETPEDTPLTVPAPGLLANDKVGSTVVSIDRQPEHGTVTAAADGSFSYVPAANHHGTDSFTYVGIGGDLATVSLTVTPVRDDPNITLNTVCDPQGQLPGFLCTGGQDDRTVDEGSSVRVRGYLTDPDFDPGALRTTWGDGAVSGASYPCPDDEGCGFGEAPTWAGGCPLLGCDGELFFDLQHTYVDDAPGDAAFPIEVTATDVEGGTHTASASATVLNVAPTVTVAQPCNDDLCFGQFSRLSVGAGGTATLRGRVTDPGTDDGTLSIDWGDGSPVTDISLTCTTGQVCPQSPTHSAAACALFATGPGCGFYTATHVYTAPSGDDGYAIAVTATDDDDGVGTASATAFVANAAPVATSFTVATDEDTPVEVDLGANVVDHGTADGDLTYTVTSGPSHGSLSGSGPTRTYTPNPDVSGSDEFTVEVCDPEALCSSMVVTVDVAAVDDPPVAGDDSATTPEDTPLDLAITDLLANDSDPDGDLEPDTFAITGEPERGSVSVDGGVVRYTPDADSFGEDSFTYEICSDGACATATVTIDVTPVNDAPTVEVSGPASAPEGSAVEFSFTVSDADPGDTFTVADGSPSCGSGTLVAGSLATAADGGTFSCRWGDGPNAGSASVTVQDAAGTASEAGTAGVSILNVTPVLTLVASGPAQVATGAPVSVSATFTDPGDDTHDATVDWGDGTESSLGAVVRAGFSASHSYAAAGSFTVTVTVGDSDGHLDSATFDVVVMEPLDAVSAAAVQLAPLVNGLPSREAASLRNAIDSLSGNNGGTATNGADDAIAAGDVAVAVSRILDAEKALAVVRSVDVSAQQAMLAGVARGLTEKVVADAKSATGCAPTNAATCSNGERRTFATIDAAVDAGHTRYAAGDWVGAVTGYLKATKAAEPLT